MKEKKAKEEVSFHKGKDKKRAKSPIHIILCLITPITETEKI